ncbi:MAG: hypothetical protein K6L73_10955 [Cellvibrionaceae bacterium]
MRHAYYLSENLDEMETVHDELVEAGIDDSHIHVLSDNESAVTAHHIRPVNSFIKTDVLRFMSMGFLVGIVLSALVLSLPLVFNITTPVGNMPFFFAAVILMGLSTWEGGFMGFQQANHKFESVNNAIHQGKHLMIVDYSDSKGETVQNKLRTHPTLVPIYL